MNVICHFGNYKEIGLLLEIQLKILLKTYKYQFTKDVYKNSIK